MDRQRSAGCTRIFLSGNPFYGLDYLFLLCLSFYVSACEVIYPLSFPLTHDVFLELCFAVILPAVGAAMVFNVGASTGGTDIVA